MHNISRNKRVRPLLWTCVLLRFICWVDDGDAVAVGAGGREGDLRRRKTVESHDVWYGGCFLSMDQLRWGGRRRGRNRTNHTKFPSTPTWNWCNSVRAHLACMILKTQGSEKHRNRIGMHMVNRAFVDTGFLSTWVFGSQELEEQRNAQKHGQNKVKPYESVYS